MPTCFLSSMDSYALEATRQCEFVGSLRFDTGKECVIARLDPPILGQPFGVPEDLNEVLLAARHQGDLLSSIREFPCSVFVARPLKNVKSGDVVCATDMVILAWAEIYRTKHDAENHIFDR